MCTGKDDRIQGTEFQVASLLLECYWSGLSASGSSTDQKRIHVYTCRPETACKCFGLKDRFIFSDWKISKIPLRQVSEARREVSKIANRFELNS